MEKLLWITVILLIFISCEVKKEVTMDEWKLVWSDEFDQEGLPNAKHWSYEVGTACEKPAGCGWGNNELQYYTFERAENARVVDGHLIIEAHKEDYKENRKYTSARLASKGKGDWKYGKFEIRARLPKGLGTWAAIWLLPTNNKYGAWPKSGEIDLMEYVGYAQDTIHGTVHTAAFNGMIGTQKGGYGRFEAVDSTFRDYVLEWTAEKIDWFVDGQHYFTFKNENKGTEAWPFDHPYHLILNLAVGGNWGGSRGVDETIWPQRMEIDYVRIYQKTGKSSM